MGRLGRVYIINCGRFPVTGASGSSWTVEIKSQHDGGRGNRYPIDILSADWFGFPKYKKRPTKGLSLLHSLVIFIAESGVGGAFIINFSIVTCNFNREQEAEMNNIPSPRRRGAFVISSAFWLIWKCNQTILRPKTKSSSIPSLLLRRTIKVSLFFTLCLCVNCPTVIKANKQQYGI